MEPVPMTWWQRVKTFEPALLRAILAAVATVALTVGVDISGVADKLDVAWSAIYAILPIVVAWWTRGAVTPNATIVEEVRPNGDVVAGPASPAPTGMVVRHIDEVTGEV